MRILLPAVALSLLVASPLHSQAGARRAAPSTRGITEVSLTLVDTAAQRAAGKPALIRIDYGQPHLRGRRIQQTRQLRRRLHDQARQLSAEFVHRWQVGKRLDILRLEDAARHYPALDHEEIRVVFGETLHRLGDAGQIAVAKRHACRTHQQIFRDGPAVLLQRAAEQRVLDSRDAAIRELEKA